MIFSLVLLLLSTSQVSVAQTDPDPWWCATEDIEQYFDVPKPTGALKIALESYGKKLFSACTATTDSCPNGAPPDSSWCAFTTVAPPAAVTAFSSHGSAASSWWADHSSKAESLAEECPLSWQSIGLIDVPNGQVWLNDTIRFAGCYASGAAESGSSPTAAPGSVASPTIASPTQTPTVH